VTNVHKLTVNVLCSLMCSVTLQMIRSDYL